MSKKKELFAVVDLETTGGLAKRDRIIEVGIVLTDGKDILDEYGTLVDPGRSIPPEITRITGITSDMVSGKPMFHEVARDIVEWTEGRIFVAHNVRFDYGFLQHAYRDLGYTYTRRLLCTARLSRHLNPQFRTHSLGTLIERYGLEVDARHRALDDARATSQLLIRWLNEQENTTRVHDFINLGVKESRLPPEISMEKLHALPDQTGVYYFYDRDGELIYIGKAKDIRSRVMQHFAPQTSKAGKMQQYVADIRFEITGSEAWALLKESIEIKKFKPKLNRAQRNSSFPYAIALAKNDPDGIYKLTVHTFEKLPEGSILCGRYPSRVAANGLLKARINEFGLCPEINEGNVSGQLCASAQMNICGGICGGLERKEQYNERVQLAADTLIKVFNRDLVFLEETHVKNEYYALVIESGKISKTGTVSEEWGPLQLHEIGDQLHPFQGTVEEYRILWHYIKKLKRPKIFYLDA